MQYSVYIWGKNLAQNHGNWNELFERIMWTSICIWTIWWASYVVRVFMMCQSRCWAISLNRWLAIGWSLMLDSYRAYMQTIAFTWNILWESCYACVCIVCRSLHRICIESSLYCKDSMQIRWKLQCIAHDKLIQCQSIDWSKLICWLSHLHEIYCENHVMRASALCVEAYIASVLNHHCIAKIQCIAHDKLIHCQSIDWSKLICWLSHLHEIYCENHVMRASALCVEAYIALALNHHCIAKIQCIAHDKLIHCQSIDWSMLVIAKRQWSNALCLTLNH